jgi:hypothetical protein
MKSKIVMVLQCFLEALPRELLTSIIIEHQLVVVFQLNKYFSSFANEDFWRGFSLVVSNKEYPPSHYSLDPRISCEAILPTSWREYAIARYNYNHKYKIPLLSRRVLVSNLIAISFIFSRKNSPTWKNHLHQVYMPSQLNQILLIGVERSLVRYFYIPRFSYIVKGGFSLQRWNFSCRYHTYRLSHATTQGTFLVTRYLILKR